MTSSAVKELNRYHPNCELRQARAFTTMHPQVYSAGGEAEPVDPAVGARGKVATPDCGVLLDGILDPSKFSRVQYPV